MAKKATGTLDSALTKALADEVKEVSRKHAENITEDGKEIAKKGEFVYPTVERMRVYDRALKLEALKLKVDNPDFGSGFKKKDDS